MDQPSKPAPHSVDRDAACIHCDYNLRGVPIDAACPECGFPVARTANGRTLADAPRRFLPRLHAGLRLMLVAMAVTPTIILLLLLPPKGRGGDDLGAVAAFAMFFELFIVATPLISLFVLLPGCWLVTTRWILRWDALTRPSGPISLPVSRIAARVIVCIGIAAVATMITLFGMWRYSVISWNPISSVAEESIKYLWCVYPMALEASMLLFVHWLALRIPAPKLAIVARLAAILCAILAGTGIAVNAVFTSGGWWALIGVAHLCFIVTILTLAIRLRFIRRARKRDVLAITKSRLHATS